jgi:glycosyltransferase involved in cell wall biosynthesis
MLHLDLTHSAHSPAQTGIQQVARGLWRELIPTGRAEGLVYDKYARRWRPLDARENAHLQTVDQLEGVRRKRPHWSTWQRLRGRFQYRFAGKWISPTPALGGLLVPEFYDDFVRDQLPRLRNVLRGPDVAIFHDAIAFHEPAWGVASTIERYPSYLRSLAAFKGIACVSAFSRQQLVDAWDQLGIETKAQLEAIPLGLRVDHLGPRVTEPRPVPTDRPLQLLCVSTLEPRKNHAALLDAAERLWNAGETFSLRLIGLHNRGFPPAIPTRVAALQAKGHPLQWDGAVSARALQGAYEEADLSLYPSLCEGFGLPVWESLYHGTPCLTTDGGALAEVAPGGGTVVVPAGDGAALAEALGDLLSSRPELERLTKEACTRPLRTMADYADDLMAFVDAVS